MGIAIVIILKPALSDRTRRRTPDVADRQIR